MYVPIGPHIRSRVIGETGFSLDPVNELIKLVSHSYAPTHVDMIHPDGEYVGARAQGGIQKRPVDYLSPKWERRYAIPCSHEQEAAVTAYMMAHIGEKYDFLDIAGIALQHDIHTLKRSICSQFGYSATYADGKGLQMLNVLPGFSNLITPEMYHLCPYLIGRCYYEFPEVK